MSIPVRSGDCGAEPDESADGADDDELGVFEA
jgi:hypothetical protein